MFDRVYFYDKVRHNPFPGKLSQRQVDGMELILNTWLATQPEGDLRQLAYVLGTVFHETATTMAPIHEMGGASYLARYRGRLGNVEPGDDVKFHGRGFVQLTGRDNYTRMSKVVGVDLVADPDRACEPEFAATILVYGMTHGSFTSHKLADYFHGDVADWVGARAIVNGKDCDQVIAGHARMFYQALVDDHTLRLRLIREPTAAEATLGRLYVAGEPFCDTLEDSVRDKKIKDRTAIPAGKYAVVLAMSPRFDRVLPRLLDVPGFEGILIHVGNGPEDTSGCILVGDRAGHRLVHSRDTFTKLFELLEGSLAHGRRIELEVVNPAS